MALWESSNASHNLPALELLNSQHSLEISSVCQGLLVELHCSHKSFKFHLVKSGDRQEITRKHNIVQGAYKHSLIKSSKTRQSQPYACADVFQLCLFLAEVHLVPVSPPLQRDPGNEVAGGWILPRHQSESLRSYMRSMRMLIWSLQCLLSGQSTRVFTARNRIWFFFLLQQRSLPEPVHILTAHPRNELVGLAARE